jgi:hypothetical protein
LRTTLLVLGITLPAAGSLAAQADVIRGKVTAAADNAPIFGAVVTATSLSGNVNRTSHTNSDGRYTITFPGGDGDYWITFSAIGFTPRRFELKRVADEAVLIADARLSPITMDTIQVTANRRRPPRSDNGRDVGGTERSITSSLTPPDQQGDLAAMAATQPGVSLIPGTNGDPSGFSVLGLTTDQNLTTLNGMNSGATDLPRDAGVSVSLATSPYDVSQGGFSGGALNVRTVPGSNYIDQTVSAIGNMPQLEWTDDAGRSLGQQYSNLNLGGRLAGPIAYDKAFYNFSWQLGRRGNDLPTLLNTDPLGLETIGVARDSVTRLLSILQGQGVPASVAGFPSSRLTDQGSLLGSVDFMPPSSSSGQALNLTMSGSWNRIAPGTPLTNQLPTSTFHFTNYAGSALLKHTAYLGLVLTETGLSFSESHRSLTPYLDRTGGSVLVQSDFTDGTSGVQPIQFGGMSAVSTGTSNSLELTNQLSWFSANNRHRVKLATDIRRDGWSTEQAGNLLGSFSFNQLADLAANTPAAFSRQLAPVSATGSQLTGSLALGDSWRPRPTLQIVYGARVDGDHYFDHPTINPAVSQALGVANNGVPDGLYVSPRLGFSWTYGTSSQIGAFAGAARIPRGVVRGGIGTFQNTPNAQLISQAMTTTGLPGAAQQLTCIGSAAPTPDWSGYAADPTTIPTTCANGAPSAFSNGSPNVVLFANDYAAQRSVRSTLQWSGPMLDNRIMTSLTGTLSLNQNQSGFQDLNFNPTMRFTLPDEGGRPVFVNRSSIVPVTGAVATTDSRVSAQFNHVSESVSDFRSTSRQLQLSIQPLSVNSRFSWSIAYTLNAVRDRVNGFASTAGSPFDISDARASGDWRHQVQVSLGTNLFDLLRVQYVQRFTSGTPFTPIVNGDINGDGYANDRAFVANPASTADTALASGMTRLLAGAGSGVRSCLTGQLGQIATRNSCEGPWTSSGFLTIAFNPLRVKLPQRANLSLQVANPIGALDLMLHGSQHLRGWGQAPTPDPRLLIVRGFDTTAQRYIYDVNPRFGATTQAVSTVRNPVALTLSLRIDLGPARERQALTQTLDRGRTLSGTKTPVPLLRAMYGTGGLINPLSTILSQSDTLHLTGPEADSLATLNRWFVVRLDSIWTPLLRAYGTLPDQYDHEEIYRKYRQAREGSVDLLMILAPEIAGVLTPSQRRQLPPLIAAYLDRRYLAAIRTGTSGSPGGVFAPGAGVPGGGMPGNATIIMH